MSYNLRSESKKDIAVTMVFKEILYCVGSEQDDASVSSTLTVDRLNDKQISVVPETKKRVTFDMEKNATNTYDSTLNDEKNSQWYGLHEYKEFKHLAKQAANQIITIESRNRAPFSYQRVMKKTFDTCLHETCDRDEILPESEFLHLLRWVEVATSRCGLEKWSLQHLSRDRSIRRRELIQTVLNIQQNSISVSNTDDIDEFIRTTCENISRPSRLFARVMAKALEAAEQKDGLQREQ